MFDATYPNSKTRRGRVQEGGTICPTITAGSPQIYRIEVSEEMSKYRLVSQGSWNERQNTSAEFRVKHYRLMNQTVEKFEEFTDHKYLLAAF